MSKSFNSDRTGGSRSTDASGGLFGLRGWQKWLAFWAGWTTLGLFEAIRLYVNYRIDGWTKPILWGLTDLYLWGIISLLVYRIAARVGLDGKTWIRSLLIHLVLALAIASVQILADTGVYALYDRLFFHDPSGVKRTFWGIYLLFMRSMVHTAVLIYFLIAFVCHAMIYYRQYRDEELRLAQVHTRLVQAQLDALKMQLHPHFLFNTLNAIAALVHIDPGAADRMIARLGELLRITLAQERIQTVSLGEELDFLERYLEIQKVRFQDRLRVVMEIEPEAMSAQVPSLILQPLVENAVQHGLSRCAAGGDICITARKNGGRLHVGIINTIPPGAPAEVRTGRGLTLTRERLAHMYGADGSFAFACLGDGRFTARMSFPFEVSPASPEENQ